MNERFVSKVAGELKLQPRQVLSVSHLLAEGATIPFIARYRKEATDSLDEVAIGAIRDRMIQLVELEDRRASILRSMEERSLLTPELKAAMEAAATLNALEDLYAPYRPKRRTKATIAREAGLEPLAIRLFEAQTEVQPETEALAFVNAEKSVPDVAAALAGARDIVAERISEDATARARLREIFQNEATVRSKVLTGKEEEGAKFKDYFDWSEPLKTIPSHRMLALRRGEAESILLVRMHPPEERALQILEPMFVQAPGRPGGEQVRLAVQDSYKRLLSFAMEAEARMETKKRADAEAIRVFADNLRELLLAPALGRKNVLAIDPGFRTGCKLVVLDRQGKLLHHDVVYPSQSASAVREATDTIRTLVQKHQVEAVAIGNGTAGRETEAFVRALKLPASIPVVMVNESGASIYSASEVARDEFPNHDVTVRGAVSIGRRLMDPLAELVKLDPKSIGVGQYQHDVDPPSLKTGLDDVVVSCVNRVGVELNTASKQLLAYVSGLGPTLAGNIVQYRNENGPFRTRKDLLKVPRLGPKAFEQCAGFLRIREGSDPLDASAVHPERYGVVDSMARDLGVAVSALLQRAELRQGIQLDRYVSEGLGMPTLEDILTELAKPGRDPRQKFETFSFQEGVTEMGDLKPGMKLPGIVTNVTAFGAFVDIGVHQDGLVHVSQLSDRFVKDPSEVVKVHQKVMVTVVEVDLPRKRIALSMKAVPDLTSARAGDRGGSGGDRSNGPRPRPTAPPKQTAPANDWFSEALRKGQKR
ncbi:MAG: RNA-binding transcriptional accessory protein [Verrucomicrobia bacterium]|nr:RNA-binding transcriptional accessory protein [Verrucomicrobiota bacterium]